MTDSTSIQVGQLSIRYLVDGSQTDSVGMFELTVPPGSNVPPPHSHVGDTMFSPKGSVHQFSNPSAAHARALIVQSPDIGAQYFRDVGGVANAGGGPPDKAALVAVMQRYGLVPAAAPAQGGGT